MTFTDIPYCPYERGACAGRIKSDPKRVGFFIYPSLPVHLASVVREAVVSLRAYSNAGSWSTWEDLQNTGHIIICSICEAIRNSQVVVGNITTLNFNVLFEIGFALGLGKPVIPVRDTSFDREKRPLEEIGIFDVLKYEDFQGSTRLTAIVQGKHGMLPLKLTPTALSREQPTYVIKTPYDLDGNTRMLAAIKKSALYRFRSYDPNEMPRLSVYDAYRQVSASYGVVSHMIDPKRQNADAHNGLCAFVSGMALALGKRVLMLQEGYVPQPIDYRALIVPYGDVRTVNVAIEAFVREVADAMNVAEMGTYRPVRGLLEKIDMGDTAAENEIRALDSYFVKTPQYQQAKKGHARLVVGRKGSGKTAIFYRVRADVSNARSIVLDLKPEGHHFTKLREQVLAQMKEGVQLHTLTSFWSYLLLLELAKKVLNREAVSAWQTPDSAESYRKLKTEYESHCLDPEGDFSERIMALVNSIIASFPEGTGGILGSPEITRMIYHRDVATLAELVLSHLQKKEHVWILFDNIDKGWTGSGATPADIAIVRSLLEATRKLQRDLARHNVDVNSIVFLRKDICDLLVDQTPDRGKESVASLDWSDQTLLEEMLRRRFQRTEGLAGDFRTMWNRLFAPHVGGDDSFRYILCRSQFQPRAVLNFVTKCIQVAVAHDHGRVEENDIVTAEKAFSEDMLNSLRYEIRDIFPSYRDILHSFLGYPRELTEDEIRLAMIDAQLEQSDIDPLVDALLWFAFIGIGNGDDVRYSYDLAYDVEKLKAIQRGIEPSHRRYIVHPAFRSALEMR